MALFAPCTAIGSQNRKRINDPNETQATPYLKDVEVREVHQVIEKLIVVAEKCDQSRSKTDWDSIEIEIKKNISEKLKHPRQLASLGRQCRAILGIEYGENQYYDEVFRAAYWHCVERLAQDKSPDGLLYFEMLKRGSGLNGAEVNIFEEYVKQCSEEIMPE